jgi:hypothetical protein
MMQVINGQMNRQVLKEEIQMANKYMKQCLTSSDKKEMQIKTTLKFYLTPPPSQIGIHQENKQQRMWGGKDLQHCWCECKLVQLVRESVWRFLRDEDPIPLFDIYPKECKSIYNYTHVYCSYL